MTNENLEQKIGGSKRLLIVEDKLDYAFEAVRVAKSRGYQVDVACDLEDALSLLNGQRYDGVLTDITFQERGINDSVNSSKAQTPMQSLWQHDPKRNDKLAELESMTELKTAYERALVKSQVREDSYKSFLGETTDERRNGVIDASINFLLSIGPETKNKLRKFEDKMYFTKTENLPSDIKSSNTSTSTRDNPALGYYIVKEAQKRNIPVVVSTMVSHATHAIPAVLATGLASVDEIAPHLETQEVEYSAILHGIIKKMSLSGDVLQERAKIYRAVIPLADLTSQQIETLSKGNESIKRRLRELEPLDDKSQFVIPHIEFLSAEHLERRLPFVFDSVIVNGKTELGYSLSLDQLEGKIEQTRPYRVLGADEDLGSQTLSRDIMREKLGIKYEVEPAVVEQPKVDTLVAVKSTPCEAPKVEIKEVTPVTKEEPKKPTSFFRRLFS